MPLFRFPRRRTSVPVLRPEDDAYEADDEDDEELARSGYVFTIDPDAPQMTLAEPVAIPDDHIVVTGPPGVLSVGEYYLLGGPGLPGCEVVQADCPLAGPKEPCPRVPGCEVGQPGCPAAEPGKPCRIRRQLFRTIGFSQPAGTPVARVTVQFVPDWEQADWDHQQDWEQVDYHQLDWEEEYRTIGRTRRGRV